MVLWYRRRRRRRLERLPKDVLQSEFSPGGCNPITGEDCHSTRPTPFLESVPTPHPVVSRPPPIVLTSPSRDSSVGTDPSISLSPYQSESGPSSASRLVVHNADVAAAGRRAPPSNAAQEKRRIAMAKRKRDYLPPLPPPQVEDRDQDYGPVTFVPRVARNSAGQLPPAYHLINRPSTSRRVLR